MNVSKFKCSLITASYKTGGKKQGWGRKRRNKEGKKNLKINLLIFNQYEQNSAKQV